MATKKSMGKKKKQAALPKNDQVIAPEVIAENQKTPVFTAPERHKVPESMTKKDTIMVVLYSLLMFVAMTVQTGRMSIVLIVLALVLCIGKKPLENMRAHLSLPMLGLIAFALMSGFASLHSRFGSVAAAELNKVMAAFSLAVILLARFEKKHVRGLLFGFAGVSAVIALICVDMGGQAKLFGAFNSYVQLLGGDFSGVLANSQDGRVDGIYNDANLTGALLGMAILVSSYLAHTAKKLTGRFFALVTLGISAVSFIVAMSRGAIAVFAVAVLVYLAAEGKDTRIKLFLLLLTAGTVSAAAGAVALVNISQDSSIPVLVALFSGLVAFALDWAITARLGLILQRHKKLFAVICVGLVAVLGCAVFTAFQITGPFVLDGENLLRRGMALEPGEYTISGNWEEPSEESVRLLVYSQTEADVLLKNWTLCYEGPLSNASFTIPDETQWVSITVHSNTNATIHKLELSDGTTIPLSYTYLPEALVSRLQDGLLKGYNFQQRLQYLRDGMVIFKQSPLIGHGLGSTEHMLQKVQSYHYESLYVHNHILQVMDEMGIVGLAVFLTMLLGTLLMLLRHRWNVQDSLAAVLIACWVMMNLHSLMEINFSIRMYQCAAFFVLMIPVLLYAKPIEKKWYKLCAYAVLAIVCLDLAIFGSLLREHRAVQKEAVNLQASNVSAFMSKIQSFAERDAFEKVSHHTNFVANAMLLEDPTYDDVMLEYVDALHNAGTYAAYMGLAQYYYLVAENWEEVFTCSRLAIGESPANSDAWNMQVDFYRTKVLPLMTATDMSEFKDGIADFESYLERCNEDLLQEIVLSAENQLFLQKLNEWNDFGYEEPELYRALTELNSQLMAQAS